MKMKNPLQLELQRVFIGSAGERGTSQSASLTAPLGKGSLWEGVFDKEINIFTDAGEVFVYF